jgi:dihydroflavonol-4-reductase
MRLSGNCSNAVTMSPLPIGDPARRPNLENLPVACRPGDHNDPDQIERWVEGHHIVIDAATPYSANLYDRAEYDALGRTYGLLDAVMRRDCRFAYVSSFTTMRRQSNKMEDWGSYLAMRLHPYFALKQRIEEMVMEASKDGLRAVIVNPTMCLGPWDSHDRELCLIPRLLCAEVPGAVDQNLNVLDVREVANGLVSALEGGRYGERLILSGHNISAQNLFGWICELAGVSPPPFTAPTSVAAFCALGLEAVLGIMRPDSPIKSLAPILMYQHEWLPPCVLFRELRITLRPLYETLQDSIAWYRAIGYC